MSFRHVFVRCQWMTRKPMKFINRLLGIILVMIVLYGFTFGVILPHLFRHRVYSSYFSMDRKLARDLVSQRNDNNKQKARFFLEHFDPNTSFVFHNNRITSDNLDLLIIVATVARSSDMNVQYLTQVAARMHEEITKYPEFESALLICNVEVYPLTHKEAIFLSRYFPSVYRKETMKALNVYEKEKLDYIFCLRHALNYKPKYVLLLEDDAVPMPSVLSSLEYILNRRIVRNFLHGEEIDNKNLWVATKLYYPERWMGFGFEFRPILELLGIAFIGSGVFLLFICVSVLCKIHVRVPVYYATMLFGAFYFAILAWTVGRQNILELRRWHPNLLQIIHAPGCCTPATLYPIQQIDKLSSYLTTVNCNSNYGIDLAIDEYAKKTGSKMYMVEPNLFQHIGFYSTLSGKEKTSIEEFLFP